MHDGGDGRRRNAVASPFIVARTTPLNDGAVMTGINGNVCA
jgi:hypothetical protein